MQVAHQLAPKLCYKPQRHKLPRVGRRTIQSTSNRLEDREPSLPVKQTGSLLPAPRPPKLSPLAQLSRRNWLFGLAGASSSWLLEQWLRQHVGQEAPWQQSHTQVEPLILLNSMTPSNQWVVWMACKSKVVPPLEQDWLLKRLCRPDLKGSHPLGTIGQRQDLLGFQVQLQRWLPTQQVSVEQAWFAQQHACLSGQLTLTLPMAGQLTLPFTLYVVLAEDRICWWQEAWDLFGLRYHWFGLLGGRIPPDELASDLRQNLLLQEQDNLAAPCGSKTRRRSWPT